MIRDTSTEITIPFAFRLPDCQVEADRKEQPYIRLEHGAGGLHSRSDIAALFRAAPQADLHINLVRKNINSEYELVKTLTLLAKNNHDQTNGIAFMNSRLEFDHWLNDEDGVFIPVEVDYSDAREKVIAKTPAFAEHSYPPYLKSKQESFFNYLSHIHHSFNRLWV